ncbi:MAG: hypothetical protein GF320_03620 [Armatimonadia bacterium]|nr:hypothetical protein [Armatimonadia bacterium]
MRVIARTEGQLPEDGVDAEATDPRLLSRRRFLRRLGLLSGLALVPTGWWAMTRRLVVEKTSLRLRGLAGSLRIAMITDTHLRDGGLLQPFTHEGVIRAALDLVREQKPDLFLFGGDLSAETFGGGKAAAFRMIDLMSEVDAPAGRYACLGNHDMLRSYGELIPSYYAASGLTLLRDEWTTLRTPGGTVSLGGLGYRRPGYADAEPLEEDDLPRPRILLAHDPTCALYLRDLDRIDLLLCGHTHGGQIHLPLIGAPWTPSPAYPTYYRGLKSLTRSSYVYVSRGVGTVLLPIRVGAAPEVTVMDLSPLDGDEREST